MTPERAKELLPIIEAFANGKKVQWRLRKSDTWCNTDDPGFSERFEYRIKPEPRMFWINVYPHIMTAWDSEKRARGAADTGAIRIAVPCREITPDEN